MSCLACRVCYIKFDEDVRRPLVYPCGHTVCKSCIHQGLLFQCPFDRKPVSSFEDLITNFQLLGDETTAATAPCSPTGRGACPQSPRSNCNSRASTPRHRRSSSTGGGWGALQLFGQSLRNHYDTAPSSSTRTRDQESSRPRLRSLFTSLRGSQDGSGAASDAQQAAGESAADAAAAAGDVAGESAGDIAGGDAAAVADAGQQRTPGPVEHQGVPLSQWVQRLDSRDREEQLRAAQALAAYVDVCRFGGVSIRPLIEAGAAQALSQLANRCLGNSRSSRPLRRESRNDMRKFLLRAAARALQMLASAAPSCCSDTVCAVVVPSLLHLLESTDDLAKLSATEGLRALVHATPDSYSDVVVQSLPLVVRTLDCGQPAVQLAAADVLTKITSNHSERIAAAAGAVPALVKLLANPNLQAHTRRAIEDYCSAVDPHDVRQRLQ